MRDPLDIQSTRGDIGGDENVDVAVLERGDRPLTLPLRDVTVDGGGGEPPARNFSATSSVACLVRTNTIIASKDSTSSSLVSASILRRPSTRM